jgi:putative endonuclease
MFFVYALYSGKNYRIYVGMTIDLVKRLKEHNTGKTRSTKAYTPWHLFYHESFTTRDLARKREKYFKSGIGKERLREKLNQILE